MPTVGESANSKVETAAAAAAAAEDDFASTDEVKVYKDEGDDDENRSSENLSEDKFGLVIETEQVSTCCLLPPALLTVTESIPAL
jgi:hypothetical protein